MTQSKSYRRSLRLLLLGLIIGLAAYWVGTRYGQRVSPSINAVPSAGPLLVSDQPQVSLDPTEAENVHIYKQAAPSVANIVTRTVQYDIFMEAMPVEGAGSGFLIDTAGHILTNYHVVEGAQTIEVTLGDQSRYKARYIGADQRNDIALIQIDPKGRRLTP